MKLTPGSLGKAPLPSRASVSKFALHVLVLLTVIAIGFLLVGGKDLAMKYNSFALTRLPDTGGVVIAVFAFVVVALVMWKAETGAILVILLMPLMDMYDLPMAGVHIKLSDWVAFVAILLFFIRLPFDRDLSVPRGPLRWPILSYIALGALSTLLMIGHMPLDKMEMDSSGLNSPLLRTWTQQAWSVYSLLLYVMIFSVIRNKRTLRLAVGCILFSSVLVGLYAVSGQRYWMGGGYRILGTFSEPSYYAEWLVFVIPIALALTMANKIKPGRILQVPLLLFFFVNFALTLSAGGYVSGLVSLALVLWLGARFGLVKGVTAGRFLGAVVTCILVATIATMIAVPDLATRIDDLIVKITNPESSKHSAMIRVRAREAAHLMFLDYPLWGVGPGNYPFHRLKYIQDDPEANEYELTLRWDPNNLYYEVLSERGIVGFVVFLWLWATYYVMLFRGIRESQDDYTKAVLIGLASGMAGVLVGYWGHANFFRIFVWVQFGIGMAAVRLAREPVMEREMASPGVMESAPDLPSNRVLTPGRAAFRSLRGAD